MFELTGFVLQRPDFTLRIPALTLPAGETVTVIGPSGGGKSSLVRALLGLEPSARFDTLRWQGQDLRGAMPHQRPFGWLSQDLGLWPHLSAGQHLAFARTHGASLKAAQADEQLLHRVGLASKLHARPGAMSGGERQRLALARVFAAQPELAFLDEPFSNLDPVTADQMLECFNELSAHAGAASVRVMHWMKQPHGDDRFWVIENGSLVQDARWHQLKREPSTPWTAQFAALHA